MDVRRALVKAGVKSLVAAVCILGASESRAGNSTTVIQDPDAYVCNQPGFIGFEAIPDQTNLSASPIQGVQFTTTGGFTWLSGDFATGGYNGRYPTGNYMSQGMRWAWLGPDQGEGRIDFVNGNASFVSLLVAVGTSPVFLNAYDSSDVLLETAGPANVNTSTGTMTELRISRGAPDIAYVVVHDDGNFFLVDSLCTNAPGVTEGAGAAPVIGAPVMNQPLLILLALVLGMTGFRFLIRQSRQGA